MIFGIKKFHIYLYGCSFALVTDHKPLLCILGLKQEIPELAAARWTLILAAYNYKIEFRPTQEHGNVGELSRLPVCVTRSDNTVNSSNVHKLKPYQCWQRAVSVNGPQFVSDEFALFLKQDRVKHIRCAPYHPSLQWDGGTVCANLQDSYKSEWSEFKESVPKVK